jgi:hypothetical protein
VDASPYCTQKLFGPSRKGLRRTQVQRKQRWAEKGLCRLLYHQTVTTGKRDRARAKALEGGG